MERRIFRKPLISGFTIIELMIVIAVIGILASVSFPQYLALKPDYELNSSARDLFSNIQKTKFEAVKRNTFCTITFNQPVASDGVTYDYLMFVDTDNDLEFDATEEIIVKQLISDYTYVSFDSAEGGGDGINFADNGESLPALAFRPTGVPALNVGGSIYLINTKGNTKRIVISSVGNVRIE